MRRHSATVENAVEVRMGSSLFGELLIDGEPFAGQIESESLVWSPDGRLLAAQQLTSTQDGPETRVIVVDADTRIQVAASEAIDGLCEPLRFDDQGVVYEWWHYRRGSTEMRLALSQ